VTLKGVKFFIIIEDKELKSVIIVKKISYYEVYKPYDKKIIEENPDYYSLIDLDGPEL